MSTTYKDVKLVIVDSNGEKTSFDVHGLNYEQTPEDIATKTAPSAEFKLECKLSIESGQVTQLAEAFRKAQERLEIAMAQHEQHLAMIIAAYVLKHGGMPRKEPVPAPVLVHMFQYGHGYRTIAPNVEPEHAQAILVLPTFEGDAGYTAIMRREVCAPKDAN